jgi:SAM-dependent methyltransferase
MDGGLFAMRDQLSDKFAISRLLNLKITPYDLAILELFAHTHSPREVYRRVNSPGYFDDLDRLRDRLFDAYSDAGLMDATVIRFFLGKSRAVIQIFEKKGAGEISGSEFVDVTQISNADPRAAVAVFKDLLGDDEPALMGAPVDYAEFEERIGFLQNEGLLAPDVGEVDWGHLRRAHPLCQTYGCLRGGTPVDRYYLDRFIELIRPDVQGNVLEIGGSLDNRQNYQLVHADAYRTLDYPELADDIVGDAADPEVVAEHSFDCILAFNVLEHCEKPQAVIDNMHRWLKPGGIAMVLVPTAQKLHAAPKDYWRPLPDALESMFKAYKRCDLHIYGTLTAVIANLHGISAEELSESELLDYHPDYPVVSCATAVK